jgi:hypothetical protein
MAQNGEECIFAATLEHETKVSIKTRELDDALILAQLVRRPENKNECSTVAAYKSWRA